MYLEAGEVGFEDFLTFPLLGQVFPQPSIRIAKLLSTTKIDENLGSEFGKHRPLFGLVAVYSLANLSLLEKQKS